MSGAPLAYVVFLLDNSGSMSDAVNPTCNAFNEYIETLKYVKGADIRFSLWLFGGNGLYRKAEQHNVCIQDVTELNENNYHPNDGTNLYPAICTLIKKVETDLAKEPNLQRKVIFCIQTDGMTPDDYVDQRTGYSRGYTGGGVSGAQLSRSLISDNMRKDWEFLFFGLGSGFKTLAKGTLGIPEENIIEYGKKKSVDVFSTAAMNIGMQVSKQRDKVGFTDEQRKKLR